MKLWDFETYVVAVWLPQSSNPFHTRKTPLLARTCASANGLASISHVLHRRRRIWYGGLLGKETESKGEGC